MTERGLNMRHSLVLPEKILALVTVLGLAVTVANARTIYVDDDAPNDPGPGDPTISDPDEDGSAEHPFDCIQEGIDAANHFDTVLVLDGTYTGSCNKNLDLGGKFITVRSENGPDTCIVDCRGTGRGFYFHYGEGEAAVVEGFTITNGSAANGGGILCEGSDPTIVNCTITANHGGGTGGGGVYLADSRATITNCRITWNTAQRGAGVYCGDRSDARITDCRIRWNKAFRRGNHHAYGGGLYCTGSSPTITQCVISQNSAEGSAYNWWYTGYGGGMYFINSSPAISNCMITVNTATGREDGYGGGVYFKNSTPEVMVNCTLAGNTAKNDGGALFCYLNTSATITNSTILDNTASRGGGVHCRNNSEATINNCILWANSAPQGKEIGISETSTVTVSYSDVRNGEPLVYVESGSTLNWGAGNIDENPMFVDAGSGDYRLWSPLSPCIDAGDNGAVPPDITDLDGDGDTTEPTPLDLDGNPRFVDDCHTQDSGVPDSQHPKLPIVDMGAYEYQPFDMDYDGDVNLRDFAGFQLCFAGPDSVPVETGCEGFDADCDNDVDLYDFAALRITGPGR